MAWPVLSPSSGSGQNPAKTGQVMNTLGDLKRSKRELIAENMFLCQQLIVLERQVERPKLSQWDRQILVILTSRIRGWREALVVVKPETLLGWHRGGFKLYWRRKSPRKGRVSMHLCSHSTDMSDLDTQILVSRFFSCVREGFSLVYTPLLPGTVLFLA
jgi:hypothetical protein